MHTCDAPFGIFACAAWASRVPLRRFFLTLLGALALLLPGGLSAKDSPRDILGHLPVTIAGCERGEIRGFGDARLGQAATYTVRGLVITVYVFDLGKAHVADGLGDELIAEAMAMAKQDIQQQRKALKVEFRDEAKASFPGGFETLRARYFFNRGVTTGTELFSEVHVFGAHDQIIKLRISGELEKEEKMGKVVEEFIPTLMKALAQPLKQEA
jgi:hypothetical protein